MTPSVGQVVHYVSHGTPGGECPKACRAAVVTGLGEVLPYPQPGEGSDALADDGAQLVDLCVLYPSGLLFKIGVTQDERQTHERSGGTWHWPERVD